MTKPKLLLHVCCAPCLSGSLFQIKDNFEITLFWFNPNIEPIEEYNKRLDELKKYAKTINLPLIISEKKCDFSSSVSGLESEPEGGKRCSVCIDLRLKETYSYASMNKYDFYATTLTVSPYKNTDKINKIGQKNSSDKCKYLDTDFKKNDGYKISIQTCKELGIYRQKYCGCFYSIY